MAGPRLLGPTWLGGLPQGGVRSKEAEVSSLLSSGEMGKLILLLRPLGIDRWARIVSVFKLMVIKV